MVSVACTISAHAILVILEVRVNSILVTILQRKIQQYAIHMEYVPLQTTAPALVGTLDLNVTNSLAMEFRTVTKRFVLKTVNVLNQIIVHVKQDILERIAVNSNVGDATNLIKRSVLEMEHVNLPIFVNAMDCGRDRIVLYLFTVKITLRLCVESNMRGKWNHLMV